MTETTLKTPQSTVEILGIRIISTSTGSVLKKITDFVAKKGQNSLKLKPLIIFTPNPEFIVAASRDREFKEILNQADINLPDGMGLVLASRLLGQPLRQRISGADVVEKLLAIGVERGWTVGIAGARRGVEEEADLLIQRLRERYQKLQIINLDSQKLEISPPVGGLKLEIVFACQGMGKQERWIMENKDKIPAAVFMGVGGSLDFLTGFAKRAPLAVRKTGLEWLWRIIQRPSHLTRVFRATVVFGWLVLKSFFRLDAQKP